MSLLQFIRDTPAGAILRLFASGRLPYPEEIPAFKYQAGNETVSSEDKSGLGSVSTSRIVLCDWSACDDPENPQNWSSAKKLWVTANIAACAFVVYMSAPIWTPSHEEFMEEFSTSYEYTSLGLGLFV